MGGLHAAVIERAGDMPWLLSPAAMPPGWEGELLKERIIAVLREGVGVCASRLGRRGGG